MTKETKWRGRVRRRVRTILDDILDNHYKKELLSCQHHSCRWEETSGIASSNYRHTALLLVVSHEG